MSKKLAYADPPYPGMARKFYREDPRCCEVNYELLIAHLDTFDGWALSTSSTSLQMLLAMCPPGVRVGAWVKPFFTLKRNLVRDGGTACYNPGYAWEPVIFRPARTCVRNCRDWHAANRSQGSGVPGAKPVSFCLWLFDLLGAEASDELVDLFPGSGVVGGTWTAFSRDLLAQQDLQLGACV